MKDRLIVFERQPTRDYLIEQDNDRRRRGGGAQRYLTAVEFVLLFTPRLVGKNAGGSPRHSRDRAASQRVSATCRNNEMVDFP